MLLRFWEFKKLAGRLQRSQEGTLSDICCIGSSGANLIVSLWPETSHWKARQLNGWCFAARWLFATGWRCDFFHSRKVSRISHTLRVSVITFPWNSSEAALCSELAYLRERPSWPLRNMCTKGWCCAASHKETSWFLNLCSVGVNNCVHVVLLEMWRRPMHWESFSYFSCLLPASDRFVLPRIRPVFFSWSCCAEVPQVSLQRPHPHLQPP